jgi:putative endonuclease
MADQNLTGKEGEREASDYLTGRGYTILHTNWRWRHYELDIVATRDDELVVIEVKTRSGKYLVPPEHAINSGKIERTVAAADMYVQTLRLDMPVRFDIILLISRDGGGYDIEHIEDAFYAPLKR